MRGFLVAVPLWLAVLAPTAAHAEATLPTVIWDTTPRVKAVPPVGFTTISHVIYLNNCLPNGCALAPGSDDSRAVPDRSSIASGNVMLDPWPHGDAAWQALVQCVRETYAPFDIQIVTDDPGTAPHSEIMIAGSPGQLNPELTGAGGVAPFLGCGATEDNTVSFMFANLTSSLNYLCGGAAQETSHVFGLDHELDPKDPLTYLDLGSRKVFQDSDADCGESLSDPRECYCGGTTQNTYQYLMDTFGPGVLEPASLTIATPRDGAWVKPGFPVRVTIMDQLSVLSANLTIDGAAAGALETGPFAFNAPATLAAGPHAVTVMATDYAMRQLTASINVTVTATCGADAGCAGDTHCLGGYCLPGASVAGGLGATCAVNDECVTGSCASDGTSSLCTGACDAGETCPAGYACLAAGTSGVCWPSADSGGCAVGGGGSSMLLLVGLGLAGTARRRRR